jgi:cell division protein ZapA (FtsZ GTPase activity inhibitor)
MREAGKTVGLERLAVVTALNVMHEYLTLDSDKRDAEAQIQIGLARVEQKIHASLGRRSSAKRVE